MKSQTLIFLALILSTFSARADWPTDVVNSSAVQGIYQLLNQANQGTCVAPQVSDLKPFCLGALNPVTQPTIEPGGCMFQLTLSCSNGFSATLSGMKHQYVLALPNDQFGQSVDGSFTIDKIDLNSK
jgi:hypothetical protein